MSAICIALHSNDTSTTLPTREAKTASGDFECCGLRSAVKVLFIKNDNRGPGTYIAHQVAPLGAVWLAFRGSVVYCLITVRAIQIAANTVRLACVSSFSPFHL